MKEKFCSISAPQVKAIKASAMTRLRSLAALIYDAAKSAAVSIFRREGDPDFEVRVLIYVAIGWHTELKSPEERLSPRSFGLSKSNDMPKLALSGPMP